MREKKISFGVVIGKEVFGGTGKNRFKNVVTGTDARDRLVGSAGRDLIENYGVKVDEAIHENVLRTSPNYFNFSRPIRVDARLEVLS